MVQLHNKSKQQQSVLGSDDKTYYIPPRRKVSLPEGVSVEGALPNGVVKLK